MSQLGYSYCGNCGKCLLPTEAPSPISENGNNELSKQSAVMVDIETLGTEPGSIIFEIAAVQFDPVTFCTKGHFHAYIHPSSCRNIGLVSDNETVEYWEKRGIYEKDLGGSDIRIVLATFADWITEEAKADELWCRGTDFDFPLIRAAYEALGGAAPWEYHQVRDVRTMWARAFPGQRPPQASHKALEDCHQQIKDLGRACNKLEKPSYVGIDLNVSELKPDSKLFLPVVLKQFQKRVFQTALSKGWHNEPREDGTMIALMHSELSEALEAARHGNPPDDKIPQYSGVAAELGDTIIRIFDFAEAGGHDVIGAMLAKADFNEGREHRHGGKEF